MSDTTQEKHAACAGCAFHAEHVGTETESTTTDGRRRVLLVMSAGALLAACGATSDGNDGATNDTGNPGDDAGSGNDTGSTGTDAGNPTDDGTPDTGTVACTPLTESLGPVTNYPLNSYHLLTNADGGNGIIVGHDSGGLYCMTAICTHQGCQVNAPNASTGAIRCACHGATYNANGTNLSVARRPLVHYQLTLCDGQLTCDTSMTVAATVRTPAA